MPNLSYSLALRTVLIDDPLAKAHNAWPYLTHKGMVHPAVTRAKREAMDRWIKDYLARHHRAWQAEMANALLYGSIKPAPGIIRAGYDT